MISIVPNEQRQIGMRAYRRRRRRRQNALVVRANGVIAQ